MAAGNAGEGGRRKEGRIGEEEESEIQLWEMRENDRESRGLKRNKHCGEWGSL